MRHCIHGLLVVKTILIVNDTLKLLTKVFWMIFGDSGIIKGQVPISVVFSKFIDELSDD